VFVKQKMEEYKAAGTKPSGDITGRNPLFSMAGVCNALPAGWVLGSFRQVVSLPASASVLAPRLLPRWALAVGSWAACRQGCR
jgi:hypothetical protein